MKKPNETRNLSTLLRSLVAGALLLPAANPAFAAIVGSYVVNADNTVTYSYRVDNSAGDFDIASWALEFDIVPDWNQLDAPLGEVTVPNIDWIAGPGIPAVGVTAQDFLSLDPTGDVLVNTILSGFSFTSAFLPGPVTYFEFSAIGDFATGQTIGPAAAPANSVPDGGGRTIELIGLLSLAALGVGRRFTQAQVEAA